MRLKGLMWRASWMMIFILPGFFLSRVIQAQQDKETTKSEGTAPSSGFSGRPVQKIFDVKFADVDKLAETLRLFGPVFSNRELRVITVSGSPELVAAVEDAIKRFDVPPPATKNIELIAYLLIGSEQASEKNTPPELDAVMTQLKSIFKYQGFRLLDTLVVRCRDRGAGSVSAVAPGSDPALKTLYDFSFDSATITSDNSAKMIRIDRLKLGAKLPVMPNSQFPLTYVETGIRTNIDLREGQKVVVGKATIDGSNNALFLVLTAKVVD